VRESSVWFVVPTYGFMLGVFGMALWGLYRYLVDDLPQAQESLGEEDWLALMKSWWGEASAEERREFLRWVGERR
ncbi:MAG TPA: hypothetical protein PLS34_11715, partial [Gammaproteobacteria bacterium]|nr:hypothetical protein [Gammaproteobacteria bacterium]